MALVDLNKTTHFTIQYDADVPGTAARAQAVLDTCERDLARLAFYLPYGGAFVDEHRIVVQVVDLVNNRDGANNTATGGPGTYAQFHTIYLGAINSAGGQISDDYARFLFVAELAEVLMPAYGYVPNDSRGEALSRLMAEEFYPAQAYTAEGKAPWVNTWMQIKPRDFTYLADAEKNDLNSLSFGVGILYFNYLRSQLKHSLSEILGAGGKQFTETYRSLTKQPGADGITPFRDLLQRFYPAGQPVTLLSNNPFPLYDASARSISLSVRKSMVPRSAGGLDDVGFAVGGVVRVRPFLNCPEQDYRYVLDRQRRQLDAVVSTVGFAKPQFSWTVNGVRLLGSSGTETVTADAHFDVPESPGNPKAATESFTFTWTTADEFSWQGLNHRLVLRNVTRDGHVRLDLAVAVTDAALTGDPDTTETTSTVLDASTVIYEQAYYEDRGRCARQLQDTVESHNRGLARAVDLVRTLPDPPPPWVAGTLVEALASVRAEVESAGLEREVAVGTVQLLAAHLGTSAPVVARLVGVEVMESPSSLGPEFPSNGSCA
jgi:hypothetical protein